MKPPDHRFKLRKFAAELLEQRCLALLHGHELLFHELHARKQAVLHRLDGRSHVGESCLELALESLLIGTESLKVTVEDASHIVIDLEQFVLQSFKTIWTNSLSPSLEDAASLSRVCAAATWAARAHGGVVLLLCYFGAGGAELVLCQSLEASFRVADGFQDPRATSVAVLGSWTWLAESHGVVALGTTVCVPVLGQV